MQRKARLYSTSLSPSLRYSARPCKNGGGSTVGPNVPGHAAALLSLTGLFERGTSDDGCEHGVDALADVLEEHRLPLGDGALQDSQHVGGTHAQAHQALLGQPLLHPGHALQLGVQHQGPALCVRKHAQRVAWQVLECNGHPALTSGIALLTHLS